MVEEYVSMKGMGFKIGLAIHIWVKNLNLDKDHGMTINNKFNEMFWKAIKEVRDKTDYDLHEIERSMIGIYDFISGSSTIEPPTAIGMIEVKINDL